MSQTPPTQDLTARQEAGWLFRVEMAITNFLLGYWKVLVGLIVAVLVGALVYGQWQNHVERVQESATAQIAEARLDLVLELSKRVDAPSRRLLERGNYSLAGAINGLANLPPEEQLQAEAAMRVYSRLMPLDPATQQAMVRSTDEVGTLLMFVGTPDADVTARIEQTGDRMMEIAKGVGGAASAEAALEAANLYRIAGNTDKRRQAYEHARSVGDGIVAFAAEQALADLELEAGNTDAGIERLRALLSHPDEFLAQEAALELGTNLEAAGRPDEARKVYEEFETKWPNAAALEEVRLRKERLAATGSAP